MAMKDWEKSKPENEDLGEVHQWDNKKTGGRVWIQKIEGSGAYYVNAYASSNSYYNIFNKRYTSLSSAINSAKRYMRTH